MTSDDTITIVWIILNIHNHLNAQNLFLATMSGVMGEWGEADHLCSRNSVVAGVCWLCWSCFCTSLLLVLTWTSCIKYYWHWHLSPDLDLFITALYNLSFFIVITWITFLLHTNVMKTQTPWHKWQWFDSNNFQANFTCIALIRSGTIEKWLHPSPPVFPMKLEIISKYQIDPIPRNSLNISASSIFIFDTFKILSPQIQTNPV